MAQIFRVVTEWSGFRGGPGFTNFFFRNIIAGGAPSTLDDQASAILAAERTHNLWEEMVNFLPDDVSLRVDTVVDQLQDTTGALERSYTVPAEPVLKGTSFDSYSAASGAVIGWTTSQIRNRRRIRGRTFLVPLVMGVYTTDGQIKTTTRDFIKTAADKMADPAALNTFGVWARPTAPGASDGVWAPSSGATVGTTPAILRSRRD